MGRKKTYSPDELRALALDRYLAEIAAGDGPFLPGRAVASISDETGLSRDYLRGIVDPVYYRENGLRAPLSVVERKTPNARRIALAKALAKRRAAKGTLARLESLAAAAEAAGYGKVSTAAVKNLLRDYAGVDLSESYAGRGTKALATATRGEEAKEIA